MASSGDQIVDDAQPAGSRHTPGQHVLAPDAILELRLLLQDEHLVAGSTQFRGKSCPTETASDRNQVECHDRRATWAPQSAGFTSCTCCEKSQKFPSRSCTPRFFIVMFSA